jgi:hypothetical protein
MPKLIGAMLLLTLGAVVAVAAPQTPSNFTETCSNERDVIAGTRGHDVICAMAGRDYVSGLQGADVLQGDGGRDTMVGGPGADKLFGSGGRDNLFTVDGKPNDSIFGGAGSDRCFIDPGDRAIGCEATFRGGSIQTASALSRAFGGQAVAAEELLSVTPSPIPPPVVTVPANCGGHPAPPPIC